MSLFKGTQPVADGLDLDMLLQDSYLLVVELRQGGLVQSSRVLWGLCVQQIERVRQQLQNAGMSARNVDYISHAQCALLDETVLGFADEEARTSWMNEPLQAKFFSRHQAGEFLYEEMREVLREPSPDPHVLKMYHRVLMLGFLGRYSDLESSGRQEILEALSARVPPLTIDEALPSLISGRQQGLTLSWLRSPWLHAVAAAVLLTGTWWGLDYLLDDLIASLATDRV